MTELMCHCVYLRGGSEPKTTQLTSTPCPCKSRSPPHHKWERARPAAKQDFSVGRALVVTGGSSPGKVVLCAHEQSQIEALLCMPNHISRFLCPCLGFQQLNWASAANCLQPRGQDHCLFPWLSPRATQTGRRADTNTAFVALGMLLLPSQTISYQLSSDSSRGQRCSQPRERFPAAAAPLQLFLGKQRWERCVFSLLSREFIMKFIQ